MQSGNMNGCFKEKSFTRTLSPPSFSYQELFVTRTIIAYSQGTFHREFREIPLSRGIMYRIFCESYQNYIKDVGEADARFPIDPFKLIVDVDRFNRERQSNTIEYQKLCDMLYYADQHIDKYPRLKAFLWTVASRGMRPQHFGVLDEVVLEEQVKLANSFLRLAYWDSSD